MSQLEAMASSSPVVVVDVKVCSTCRSIKPLSDFYFLRLQERYRSQCKVCYQTCHGKWRVANAGKVKQYRRNFVAKHADKVRAQQLRIKFNITTEQYDALLKLQHGVCAICRNPPPANGRKLAVDHRHGTKIVRGLLCARCNGAIGMFVDDPIRCRAAAIYLESRNG